MHQWRQRGFVALCVLAWWGASAWARPLTTLELTELATYITTTTDQPPIPQNADQAAADLLNAPAVPAFWVWRTSIPPEDYTGENTIVWPDVKTISDKDAQVFEWMTGGLVRPINAADDNVRAGIEEAFGKNSDTTANLFTIARRQATRAERIWATGAGGTTLATVGKVVWEGLITRCDVARALGRPGGC
jgi:hypothetical protein